MDVIESGIGELFQPPDPDGFSEPACAVQENAEPTGWEMSVQKDNTGKLGNCRVEGISGFDHKMSEHTEMKLTLYGNDTNQ